MLAQILPSLKSEWQARLHEHPRGRTWRRGASKIILDILFHRHRVTNTTLVRPATEVNVQDQALKMIQLLTTLTVPAQYHSSHWINVSFYVMSMLYIMWYVLHVVMKTTTGWQLHYRATAVNAHTCYYSLHLHPLSVIIIRKKNNTPRCDSRQHLNLLLPFLLLAQWDQCHHVSSYTVIGNPVS